MKPVRQNHGTIFFITTNKHKVEEVSKLLASYGIAVKQVNRQYEENHDDTIQDIARKAAKKLAEELNVPVVV